MPDRLQYLKSKQSFGSHTVCTCFRHAPLPLPATRFCIAPILLQPKIPIQKSDLTNQP